jgi:hypothetical protein
VSDRPLSRQNDSSVSDAPDASGTGGEPQPLDAALVHDTLSRVGDGASGAEGAAMEQESGTPTSADGPPSTLKDPLPLASLVALLANDGEHDIRWGARRQGDRIPFCKQVSLTRVEPAPPVTADANESGQLQVEVEAVFEGWALNICHGGMRVITEEPVRTGEILRLSVISSGLPYSGQARVCWVRQEADGVICGLEFTPGGAPPE